MELYAILIITFKPQFNVLWGTTIATLIKKSRADKFSYK
jgi:hypothetical protein|nr:MAG TPA: contact dependent inhibitor A [Caudoviricetes sp.]